MPPCRREAGDTGDGGEILAILEFFPGKRQLRIGHKSQSPTDHRARSIRAEVRDNEVTAHRSVRAARQLPARVHER